MGRKSITVDIHGMTVRDALEKLQWIIGDAADDVDRITVIHGCNGGTTLRDAVRKRLRSERIVDIVPTFANDGESVIYLKRGR